MSRLFESREYESFVIKEFDHYASLYLYIYIYSSTQHGVHLYYDEARR